MNVALITSDKIAGGDVINNSASSNKTNPVYSSPAVRGKAARRQSPDATRGQLANHRADSKH